MSRPTNLLYYGDNLSILREHRYFPDESVDLIYLDPPFNSEQNYNVLFNEQDGSRSKAQIKAFEDTWRWDQGAVQAYEEVVEAGGRVSQAMQAFRKFLGESDMMAYLSMMAPRLIELHRVLQPTGSIYLHCDPTASHYLKMLMDAIFHPRLFQNEIVWYFRGGGVSKTRFGRRHNILLFYSKGDSWTFNADEVRTPYSEETLERLRYKAKSFRGEKVYDSYEANPLGKHPDDVWELQPIMPSSKERLGYPTQKPEALLERVIKASSNPDDIVLDPFCGCGTSIVVSQRLKRQWIGIDITYLAINLIKQRLRHSFGERVSYEVIGEPTALSEAKALAEQDPYQFQFWALGLVEARTVDEKRGADRGIDGSLYFHDESRNTKQVIISVKSGHLTPSFVRDLLGVVERENAAIGVLISMEEPTRAMRSEAAAGGFYKSRFGTKHPRLQLLTVSQLLEGKRIDYPMSKYSNITFKRAEAHPDEPKSVQGRLFD